MVNLMVICTAQQQFNPNQHGGGALRPPPNLSLRIEHKIIFWETSLLPRRTNRPINNRLFEVGRMVDIKSKKQPFHQTTFH